MILELIFLSGLATGIIASLILVLIFYKEEKASKEFDERQEKYKKMI